MPYYTDDVGYVPPRKLDESRNFWKYLVFSFLTCGIYDIMFFMSFSFDIDKVASRHDGKKTINYLFAYIIGIFTLSIVRTCWFYDITNRVSAELVRRGIEYDFTISDFWKWAVLGELFIVGPFIYISKLIKAMNLLCRSYNEEREMNEKRIRRDHQLYM